MKVWRKPLEQSVPVSLPTTVLINSNRCKGCGFCVEFCPQGVLKICHKTNNKGYLIPEVLGDSQCLGCGLCEVICPDFAICVLPVREVK